MMDWLLILGIVVLTIAAVLPFVGRRYTWWQRLHVTVEADGTRFEGSSTTMAWVVGYGNLVRKLREDSATGISGMAAVVEVKGKGTLIASLCNLDGLPILTKLADDAGGSRSSEWENWQSLRTAVRHLTRPGRSTRLVGRFQPKLYWIDEVNSTLDPRELSVVEVEELLGKFEATMSVIDKPALPGEKCHRALSALASDRLALARLKLNPDHLISYSDRP